MIGAIIGDLAAWTWENDHEKFYPSLISEKALLSEFGLSVLATADALDFNLFMNEAEYQEYIRPWFRAVNDDVVCYLEHRTLEEVRPLLEVLSQEAGIDLWDAYQL